MSVLSLPALPLNLLFPHSPPSYDTAWSFLLREEPAVLALMRDPVAGMAREIEKAKEIAGAKGLQGIMADGVTTFPAEVWESVFPVAGDDPEDDGA